MIQINVKIPHGFVRMVIIKMSANSKCWKGCGEGNLVPAVKISEGKFNKLRHMHS